MVEISDTEPLDELLLCVNRWKSVTVYYQKVY